MTSVRRAIAKIKTEGYPFPIGLIFLATASTMLIVASLSAPMIRSCRIFRLEADVDGVTRFVNFGIWGYCIDYWSRDGPNANTRCSPQKLGWTIGSDVTDFLRIPPEDIENVLSSIETAMLVIYPLATVLSFLTFILSLAVYVTRKSAIEETTPAKGRFRYLRTTFALGCFTAFTTFFVLLVHVELVTSVQKLVHARTSGENLTLRVKWGNATWLSISALMCLLGNTLVVRSIRIAKRRRTIQISQAKSVSSASPEKPSTAAAESHVMAPMGLH